jgi:hypothetical protein
MHAAAKSKKQKPVRVLDALRTKRTLVALDALDRQVRTAFGRKKKKNKIALDLLPLDVSKQITNDPDDGPRIEGEGGFRSPDRGEQKSQSRR